jgi:hypothetical protein
MKKFAFPDTSVFLYFHPLDQIDLAKMLECDHVEVVISPAVIEELEKQGWDHPQIGIRKRSQYSLRKIRSWMQTSHGLIRPNVELTLCQAPGPEIFHDHHLDPKSRDDLAIANVIQYSEIHGSDQVLLLTNDVRRQLKAHRHNLQTVRLPAEAMLPQAQVAAPAAAVEPRRAPEPAQARTKLELRFANGSRMLDVTASEEDLLTSEMIDTQLDELRVWSQEPLRFRESKAVAGIDDREAASMLINALLIPDQEYDRYSRELEEFLSACELWLRKRVEAKERLRRMVRLDFELVNLGNTTAEGLVVTLMLPKKLTWSESLGKGEMPSEPRPPKPPRTQTEIVHESIMELYSEAVPSWTAGLEASEAAQQDDWLIEGQDLRGLVDECLHHRTVSLPPVYAVFADPADISNFAIAYVINQRNDPMPVDGRLLVRVS